MRHDIIWGKNLSVLSSMLIFCTSFNLYINTTINTGRMQVETAITNNKVEYNEGFTGEIISGKAKKIRLKIYVGSKSG